MTKNRDISNILDQNTTFTATVSVGSGTANVFANSTIVKVANSTVNTYLRVPTTTEYAGNYYLHANGTWQLVSAGATPGGSNTYVQFNDSTALGGTAGFTFDKGTNNAVIANTLTVGTATINSTNYSQTANNALNLGGTAAAGYQTTAGLSANVATLTANNATWHGTSVFANSTGAYPTSNSVGAVLGNTISRVIITGNSATFISTLAAADTTVTGFVNATTVVNSAAHTIGTTLIANTLGVYHTGIMNAASFTTTGFLANTTVVVPASNSSGQTLGNTISRWVITGNSATFSSTLAATDTTITGFVNATVSVNSAAHTIGTTFIANTLGVYHTGTMNAASFTTTGFLANATHVVPTSNSSGQTLGNTISRWVITANSLTISGALNANGTVGTNGQALISNGTIPYWGTVTASAAAGGANTQVQFNDSTAIGGSAGFTFDKAANNVFYANTLTTGNSTVNSVSNSTTILLSNSTTETISANSAALAIGNSTVNNTLNSVCIAINVSPTANLTSNTVIVQLANASGTSNLTPVSLAIATSLLANSLGLYPGSNTVGNLFGNTISRWDAYIDTIDVGAGVIGNSIGIYPASNTVGMNFGNTISRWIITANSVTTTGLLANSLGLYPTSNTVGQLFGNTIARWTPTFIGQSANSLGFYPVSNTVGNLLGNTISRFDVLASTIGASGVTTLAGQVANSLGFYPSSNTVGQLFGNTISRFDITANSITTSGNIELGAATDTTLSRSAAGALDVEGHTVVLDDVENQAISGGGTITEKDLGVVAAAGTLTLDMGDRPHQKYNANGAHTLAPGAVIGSCLLIITNGTSAGAMTTSGWTKVAGDAYTTTSANKFVCHASVSAAGSLLIIQAMQ